MSGSKVIRRKRKPIHHTIKKVRDAAPADTLTPEDQADFDAFLAAMAGEGDGEDSDLDSDLDGL